MPAFDAASTIPLPLWAVGALLGLLIAVCVTALRRSGTPGSVAALFGIPALVIIAWSAWSFVDHSLLRQRILERQALDARLFQLTASAITPGSALACLDATAGETIEAPCERAVFVRPEVVAAATAYIEVRLRLLADGLDYARRGDRAYHAALAGLRRAMEADRFGFVAHVLATRDGCTVDRCEAFALLRDAGPVKANLQAGTYDKTVARYAKGWTEQADAKVAAAAVPAPALPEAAGALVPTITAVTKSIDFPSATSIPPISIMNAEPSTTAASTAEAAPANRPASPPRRPAANGNASPTVPTAPPAASASPSR